ncbi:hypothetical protein K438DRAFT_1782783 [Mycena galopus ATCC 62051]|nr:hypothetical protein K438DRAFT_1782783 [Mycena galopus ATCC 62051]
MENEQVHSRRYPSVGSDDETVTSFTQVYQDVNNIDFGFDLKPAPFPVHPALPSKPASTLPPSVTVVALSLAVSLTTSTLSLQVVRPASGTWPKSSSRSVLTLPMRAPLRCCPEIIFVPFTANNYRTCTKTKLFLNGSSSKAHRQGHSANTPKIKAKHAVKDYPITEDTINEF